MLTNNVIAIDLAKNVLQICHISVALLRFVEPNSDTNSLYHTD